MAEALAKLVEGESSSFMDDVFTMHHSDVLDATFLVFNCNGGKGDKPLRCWSAMLLHSTGQFFIKLPQAGGGLCSETLLLLLDIAEEMGAVDAFVCVPRDSPSHDDDVNELLNLDFSRVAPREGLTDHFSIVRFEF